MFITKKEYRELVSQRDGLMELAERAIESSKEMVRVAEEVSKDKANLLEQNKLLKKIVESYIVPCDLCKFNPPSSFDDKPCSVCPAQGKGDAERAKRSGLMRC